MLGLRRFFPFHIPALPAPRIPRQDISHIINMYSKIIIHQYGKVGSTSICSSLNGKYIRDTLSDPKEYPHIIQTHNHFVAAHILENFKNVLVINIVRLPIDRNISAFFQSIHKELPDYASRKIEDLIQTYDNTLSINRTDKWMRNFCKTHDLDPSDLNFDMDQKFLELKKNTNTMLFYRYEDMGYVIENVLSNYGIHIENTRLNVGEKKDSAAKYMEMKKNYVVPDEEIENINNSVFANIFYSKDELQKHIEKYGPKTT